MTLNDVFHATIVSTRTPLASTGSVDSQTDSHELLRAGGHAERWAILAWTVTRIAFWTGVAGWLHRIKWYWTL